MKEPIYLTIDDTEHGQEYVRREDYDALRKLSRELLSNLAWAVFEHATPAMIKSVKSIVERAKEAGL